MPVSHQQGWADGAAVGPRGRVWQPQRRHGNRPARRNLPCRLLDGLRRRLGYAWSLCRGGEHRWAAEAAFDWLLKRGGGEDISLPAGEAPEAAAVVGGALETVLAFGGLEPARRWAAWLMSVQQPHGALGQGSDTSAALWNTTHAAGGLLAATPYVAEARAAARAAFAYLRRHIGKDGRFASLNRSAHGTPGRKSRWRRELICLPRLLQAAEQFNRPDWETAARLAWQCAGDRHAHSFAALDPRAMLTDEAAWAIATLIDWGEEETAAQALAPFAALQRRNGAMPAWQGAGWVSAAGLAHLAVCSFRLGQRRLGQRALRFLARRQEESGGFRGGWGPGTPRHARAESTWAAKFFLDASRLQVQEAFEYERHDVPEAIDPADGRLQAVLQWVAQLPASPHVADVGCGKGRYLQHLAKRFPDATLTGVDGSSSMLRRLPAGVRPLQASVLRIPVPDGAFDGAFAVESLEHSLLPRQAVAELCRVVRPGGRVLIIDKDRRWQPLSVCQPWERWFRPEQLAAYLSPYCDRVQVQEVSHLEAPPGQTLFLAASGRRLSE